jgi:hypothetical protein
MPDALGCDFLNARIGKNDRMISGVFIFFYKPMELVFYNALTCPESEKIFIGTMDRLACLMNPGKNHIRSG